MNGRYGAYVQLGETPEGKKAEKPKRSSLQGGMTESTVTLDEALKLLSLPRVVGLHPDDNEPISTNFGRFGPYVKHGDEFRSLESEDQVFAISFDDALALIRAPKQSRRRGQQGASKKTLRELTHEGATIKLLAGRYGPYVTDGSVNASLPKTADPNALTFEQATELLNARRDMAPAPKRGGFKRKAAATTAPKAARAKKKAS
jgi:DNA topoisomerase-1